MDMVIETESARFLAYRAMDLQGEGQNSTWQSSVAKAFGTEMASRRREGGAPGERGWLVAVAATQGELVDVQDQG